MTLLENALTNLIELEDLINRRDYEDGDWERTAYKYIQQIYDDLKVVHKAYEGDRAYLTPALKETHAN